MKVLQNEVLSPMGLDSDGVPGAIVTPAFPQTKMTKVPPFQQNSHIYIMPRKSGDPTFSN